MKIVCVGYRRWAIEKYEGIKAFYGNSHEIVVVNRKEYSETRLEEENPDMVLFYGWSWIIDESIINKYKCKIILKILTIKNNLNR